MVYLMIGIIMYGIIIQNLINLPDKTVRFYAWLALASISASAFMVIIGLVKLGVFNRGIY